MADDAMLALAVAGIRLSQPFVLVDGARLPALPRPCADGWLWQAGALVARLRVSTPQPGVTALALTLSGLAPGRPLNSLGLGFDSVVGAARILRNGHHSWDGSSFEAIDGPVADGHAMTALLPAGAGRAAVLGFERHDRFQSRFRATTGSLSAETLWDRVPHQGSAAAETLLFLGGDGVEDQLRRWSRLVAAASPLPPRLGRRLTGWASWYNLYASIDPANLEDHMDAAAAFRDAHAVPLEVFQIDDGFTPEMGDWLDFRAHFPEGVAPLLARAAGLGFTPGLWIAPFMVGNRSRLFRDHPDWVVRDAATGAPIVQMQFHGEFRWHKRSEEYHILDITHPDAAAYIATVFRTWHGWGARYFKIDFMLFGSVHGPDRAVWHAAGLSRIAIWRRMLAIIRDAVGDSIIAGCGCPLWASIGLVDAVRIGRDVGVRWQGDQSAESLLRDQLTRNHGHGILWQADPDCLLLRERFHELADAQVETLARFAGLSGGVLMTSDHLGELGPARAALFADLLRGDWTGCHFPELGQDSPILIQQALHPDGSFATHRCNLGASAAGDLAAFASRLEP